MIELKNIGKYYGQNMDKLHVLRNITLSIQAGEVVAITGPSGSGKSTLLNIIGLLDHYSIGSFELNSKLIKNLREEDEADLRNTFIGFIFQSFHLISYKTALENVELPLIYRRLSKRERREIAIHFLEKVDLGDRINHLPAELSGGQKQRVAIARSLVTEPQLIIADEPTGALDSKSSQEILNLLLTLNKDGKTIILVTHDDNIAKRCQRIVRLEDGCIVEDGYVV